MRTPICDELDIEFPIFAFTHCRDVVAAVSKAGGFGVLGAVGFSPEQLEVELAWIDEHGRPALRRRHRHPRQVRGHGRHGPRPPGRDAARHGPAGHVDFAKKLLADHGVPELPDEESNSMKLLGWTQATAMPQIEVALAHPKVRLIANALGTPPADVIEHIHDAGLKVAALCGSPYQALKHKAAGVDIVIGQGGEGGGHTGEVGSIVLWPQIAKAIAPTPMLAAGGVGSGEQIAAAGHGRPGRVGRLAVAHGRGGRPAAGAEAAAAGRAVARHDPVAQLHRQAVPHDQDRLDRGLVAARHARPAAHAAAVHGLGRLRGPLHRYADKALDVMFNPVGQVVGQLDRVEKTAAVVQRLVEEYLDAVDRLNALTGAAAPHRPEAAPNGAAAQRPGAEGAKSGGLTLLSGRGRLPLGSPAGEGSSPPTVVRHAGPAMARTAGPHLGAGGRDLDTW